MEHAGNKLVFKKSNQRQSHCPLLPHTPAHTNTFTNTRTTHTYRQSLCPLLYKHNRKHILTHHQHITTISPTTLCFPQTPTDQQHTLTVSHTTHCSPQTQTHTYTHTYRQSHCSLLHTNTHSHQHTTNTHLPSVTLPSAAHTNPSHQQNNNNTHLPSVTPPSAAHKHPHYTTLHITFINTSPLRPTHTYCQTKCLLLPTHIHTPRTHQHTINTHLPAVTLPSAAHKHPHTPHTHQHTLTVSHFPLCCPH
jgi:hypothetical protein